MTRRMGINPLVGPYAFTAELPSLPPHLNHAYTNYRQGGRGLTPTARRWRSDAQTVIQAAANAIGWTAHARQPIALEIWFYDPVFLHWDLDGVNKLLWDALQAAIQVDDRYVVDAVLRKRRSAETRVILTVTKVDINL